MRRVTVVGVGLLGSAVARRLLAAGLEVTGCDMRPEALEALRSEGLRPAPDLADAVAGADAVVTVLPTPQSVEAVFGGPAGLLTCAPRAATLIQMSTISPAQTRALAAAAAAAGVGFLDAPMSGTSVMVARGEGTVFVGGDPGRLAACRPVFDAVARATVHVGEPGAASLVKLCANLLVGLNTLAVAEALMLGARGGLEPPRLLALLQQSAASSRMLELRGPLMVERRFEPQMKVELFVKDFGLMLDEGVRLGVPLPLTALAHQLAAATVAAGRGGQDLAAVVTTLERLAGGGG